MDDPQMKDSPPSLCSSLLEGAIGPAMALIGIFMHGGAIELAPAPRRTMQNLSFSEEIVFVCLHLYL